jgi:hypothetical protein
MPLSGERRKVKGERGGSSIDEAIDTPAVTRLPMKDAFFKSSTTPLPVTLSPLTGI